MGSLLEVGTGFHPELTGRENIYLNGAILGMRRAEIDRKFDEIVDFSGVEKFIDTPVKRYSSGMNVRLGFAVAAHLEPEILLVDEVLAVGDAAFQKKCLGKMGDVAREGRTVLFVSHNMEAVQRICQRCVLLDDGEIGFDATPRAVIDQYLHSQSRNNNVGPVFARKSPFTDVTVEVNGKPNCHSVIWKYPCTLSIAVVVKSDHPVPLPRVDIAFYRLDGLKLFAVRSDRLIEADREVQRKDWVLTFEIGTTPLGSQQAYFDVGVREHYPGRYLVLWQRVCEIVLDAGEPGDLVTRDSLLAPEVVVRTHQAPS